MKNWIGVHGMLEMIETNWIVALVVLLLAVLVAWLIWGRGSKERQRAETVDVLSEGAAPAERNTALIDAPPAAAAMTTIAPAPASVGMAGIGEVVAQAAEQEIEAVPAPAPVAAPLASSEADDLTRIKGIGPKLRTRLSELGVTRFEQIAGWTDADIARIDASLGSFAGRPTRDNWVEQARLLSSGDSAGYEAKFGKL